MPTDRVDEIMGQWREAAERGRFVDPEALLESHPDHAEELADRFAAQALVDHYYAEADSLPLVTPERIGDYRILREIGRGGMGVVYEAMQESMDRRVALKVLYPTIATTVRTRKRFEREARVTGKLHHTNVVTVYAMGHGAGYVYFAMELIEGQPLDKVIEHLRAQDQGEATAEPMQKLAADLLGRGRYQRLALKMAGVADALHVAHSHGVIHRDVKPSNLVLDGDGDLKLTDFGLAQLVGEDFGVTRTGEVLGTPLYMSPEQVRARRDEVDQRTDVYSLGATLYELLALSPPHDGKDIGSLCSQILAEEPRPLRSVTPDVPKDLATIVHKALHKERGDRYPTAGEMAADLRAFAEGRPISARRIGATQRAWRLIKRRPVRSALVALVILLAGTGLWLKADADRARERQEEVKYVQLIEQAHDVAMLAAVEPHDAGHLALLQIRKSEGLFSRAIKLKPNRVDAWLGRALIPARGRSQCSRDLKRATDLGLSARTAALVRAYISGRRDHASRAGVKLEGTPDPTAPLVDLYLSGWVLVGEGRPLEGIRYLDAAIAMAAPRHFIRRRALETRALAHEASGAWEDALQDFSVLHELSGDSPNVSVLLATAWRKLGNAERAEAVFRGALERARELSGPVMWSTLTRSVKRSRHGPWIDAAFKAAVEQNPRSPAILASAAEHSMRTVQEKRALSLLQRAIALSGPDHPDWSLVRHHREEVLLQRDLMHGASPGSTDRIAALRRLVATSPDDFDLHRILTIRLLATDSAEASRVAERALELRPNDPTILTLLADSALREQRLAAAEELLMRGLRSAPSDRTLLLGLSTLQTRRGDLRGALESSEKGLAVTPGDPHWLVLKAQALTLLGRPKEALVTLTGVTPESYRAHALPPHPLEHYVRGIAMLGLGNLDGALAAFKRLSSLDAGPQGHLQQALVLRMLGRLDEAMAALDGALARRAHSVNLLIYRAAEALYLGRIDAARADLDEARRAAPTDPRLARVVRMYKFVAGDAEPSTPDEHLEVANVTIWANPKQACASWGAALGSEAIRGNLEQAHLYNAACAAALAGRAEATVRERTRFLKQAIDWLTEFRDRWQRQIESLRKLDASAADAAQAQWAQLCRHARLDPDLLGLREQAEFKTLFEEMPTAAGEGASSQKAASQGK